MELSLINAVTFALDETNVKIVSKQDDEEDEDRTFLCLYEEQLTIDISVSERSFRIVFNYIDSPKITNDNVNNLLNFFSMINGRGGICGGLCFNVNLLSDNLSPFCFYTNYSLFPQIKSKYYRDVMERFKLKFAFLINDAIQTLPYISEIINEKKEPKEVFREWLKRPQNPKVFVNKIIRK